MAEAKSNDLKQLVEQLRSTGTVVPVQVGKVQTISRAELGTLKPPPGPRLQRADDANPARFRSLAQERGGLSR